MKKLICAILICLMLPITSLMLVGCNDKDYDIKKFYTAYQEIGNNTTNLTLTDANDVYGLNTTSYKIDIDYSKSSKLSTLVNNSSTQYYQLKHFYQQLLDDSLSPLYFFGEAIANKKVSDKYTKQLFTKLSVLEEDYKDIDYYLGILMNSLNATEDTNINLSYLKKVFNEYEQAITTANDLSAVVCEVYFGTVISNPNYNYSAKTADQLTETDLTRISMDVRARMYYYKSVYANIYNQLYIRGNNLATQLASSTSVTLPTYTPYNNLKTIKSLTSKPNDALLINKNSIHANAVALYNIQNSFDKAYNTFNTAINKIVYNSLDSSSTIDEKNYGAIIIQFSNGIAVDSYEILNKLIGLLYL